MNFKKRARIAVEAGKILFPELYKQDTGVFAEAVKSIALMKDEDLRKLNERSVLVAHSTNFLTASSADFYRLQELYQDKKQEMNNEYSDGKLHEEKKEYPEANIPKENSDGKQVKESPIWLSEVAEVVRKELEKIVPKKIENYDYPEKNIPKESSKNLSDNSIDTTDKEVQKIADEDEKEALMRAETKSGESVAGDGQVLYDPAVEKKDPYGYANGAPQPVEGDKRVAGCGEEAPAEEEEVVASAEEEEVVEDLDSMEEDLDLDEDKMEDETQMEYPEGDDIEEEIIATSEEDFEMASLFGEDSFSNSSSLEDIMEEDSAEMFEASHSKTASLQKGRIPAALMVSNKKNVKSTEESDLATLFGNDF